MSPPLSQFGLGDFDALAHIGLILLLAVAANWLGRRTVRRALGSLRFASRSATPASARVEQRLKALGSVLSSVVTFIVVAIAGFMALGELGINLGPLIAGAGIVGVAIGFGAQSLVKDFFSGIFILAEDQFGVGDLVTLNADTTGTVEGVSLRATRLRALDGTLWTIPNGEITQVGNQSQLWSRALVDVEVAYDTDIDLARETIERVGTQLAEDDDAVLEAPEVWGVQELGANGVALRVVTKTAPAENLRVRRVLHERIKKAFDREGIEIPFPQLVFHTNAPDAA